MPDSFGGIEVDEPQTDQFGGIAVEETPTATPLKPVTAAEVEANINPYERARRVLPPGRMTPFGPENPQEILAIPQIAKIPGAIVQKVRDVLPPLGTAMDIYNPRTALEKGLEGLHEAVAPAVSDFLRTSGIDPSSTPDKIINFPRATSQNVPNLPGLPPSNVMAGVLNLASGTGEMLAQPENAVLALSTGGEGIVSRAAAMLFAAQQFQALPGQIKEAITTIADPNKSLPEKIEAAGRPGVNALLTAGMVRAGTRPIRKVAEPIETAGKLTPSELGVREVSGLPRGPVPGTDVLGQPVPREVQPPPVPTEPVPPRAPQPALVPTQPAGAAPMVKVDELISRPAGAVDPTTLANLSDADTEAYFNGRRKNEIATQRDGVLAGMKLASSDVEQLRFYALQAQRKAMEAIKANDNTAFLANSGKVVWLNGAIEGALRKGPNYDLVSTSLPREATPATPQAPPAPATGMVRLYQGSGGAEGAGQGGAWFTTNPERAASFGPNIQFVDVPQEVADAAAGAAQGAGSGTAGDHMLPADWVKQAKPLPGGIPQKVFETDIITKPPTITAAAYFPKGATAPETGPNHPAILERLGVKGFETPESRNTPEFGYVLSDGRFITREEAGPISKASGQNLVDFEPGEPVHSNEVASPTEPEKPLSEAAPIAPEELSFSAFNKNLDAVLDEQGIPRNSWTPEDRRKVFEGVKAVGVSEREVDRILKEVKELERMGLEPKIPPGALDRLRKKVAETLGKPKGVPTAPAPAAEPEWMGKPISYWEQLANNLPMGSDRAQLAKSLGVANQPAKIKRQILRRIEEIRKQPPKPAKLTAAAYMPEGATAPETGPHHPGILKRLGIKGFETPESRNTPQFGFVDETGAFLTREQAAERAKLTGQDLKTFEPGEPAHSDEVASPIEPEKPLSEAAPATAPSTPAPVSATPVDPADKAQAEVGKVAATEGQRPAKDIKDELVTRLEKAVEEAKPDPEGIGKLREDLDKAIERGRGEDLARKAIGAALEKAGVGKVTIDIPGDGVFTVWNVKPALEELLERAKRISTKPGEPVKVKKAGVSKEDKEWIAAQLKAQGGTLPTSHAQVIDANSETAELGEGGETGAEMSRHNTPTGLPPSVPDNGPNFPAELLETSRQLGTLVRSRVTLPKGIGGWYVRTRSAIAQTDRIEVGDIRNQLTVAHEMGHDIDALIWPKVELAKTQQSLAQRVGDAVLDMTGNRVTGKELQNELIPISELMRGPISGSKGHIAYRKSAAELIADFFALYAHDPQRARGMAPMFSTGFERALGEHAEAGGVINQLLEGNIVPVPAETETPGPAATPQETPSAVPSRPLSDPVKRDLPAAQKGEDLVKGLVREFAARVEHARIVADQWRDKVPSRDERADVGAFVEGIGNVEHAGDTIENVKARMTPAMEQLAKTYRFEIEAQRQDINSYLKDSEQGEYLKFLEDYLPHFYANIGTPAGRSALSRFMRHSPNAKQRKLPTVREAVDLGLIPITQDPAVLYEHHAAVNWRTATNRKLMQALKDMTLSDGTPAVVPAKDAPAGWVITQNPLVQKVYAHQVPNGVMIWKGGAAVHPDVWRAARQMLDLPVSSDFGKAYDALNAVTRANAFAFSLFHDITLRSAALGEAMQWYNPVRGLFRLFERDPKTGELKILQSARGAGRELLKDEETVADAARHGLKFAWTDSESYQHNARDFLEKQAAKLRGVPVLGKAAGLARDLQHMRQVSLWKNTHDAFKILAYHDAVAKALDTAPPGTDPKLVKETIASKLNDAFGGQEWQTHFWLSPQLRHTMSRFLLAPDWTFSTVRSIPGASDVASALRSQASRLSGRGVGPASYEGATGNLGRARFWGGEIAALATATLAAQYAIYQAFGDPQKGDKPWVWENEEGQGRRVDVTPLLRQLPWHDQKDPTRYYVNLGKRPEEILGWFTHMDTQIQSKMSRPVAEIFKQVSGDEGLFKAPWKMDHETFLESLPQRALSAGKELVPFVFAGNQFALSVPYRKGMTKFKAQQAYESVYEMLADPGVMPTQVKAFLRGVPAPEGTLRSMVSQITDAAKRNGVPAEQIRARALSEVRGHHYDLFFKAFQKQDRQVMEREAEALRKLGATIEERMQSLKRRQALQPRPVNQ